MAKVDKSILGSRVAPEGLRIKMSEALRAPLALSAEALGTGRIPVRPDVSMIRPPLTELRPDLTKLGRIPLRPPPFLRPPPIPRPPAGSSGATPKTPPSAPRANPFADLPYRSPGDRILAEDFNRLSQALEQLTQSYGLSSALFGVRFGEARSLLESQGYVIRRALSVFGNLLENLQEESAADRLVVSVSLASLGGSEVDVLLSERVEGRRFVPELRGRTHAQAREAMRNLLADVPVPPSPGPTLSVVGSTLSALPGQF